MLWVCSWFNVVVFFGGTGMESGSSEISILGLCSVVWLIFLRTPVSTRHCPDSITLSDNTLVLVLGFGAGGGRTLTLVTGFSSTFSIFVSSSFSTYSLFELGWLIDMLERA